MNIRNDLDLTQIFTLAGFIGSLVLWGMKLEREVGSNTASVEAFQKIQEARWEESVRRLDALRRDISVLEEKLQSGLMR